MSFAVVKGAPTKNQLALDAKIDALLGNTGRKEDRYTIGRILFSALKDKPNFVNTIECSSGERILNKALLDKSVRTARALRGVGVKKGDVVMIVGTRHLLLSVPYYASTFIGAVSFHVDENATTTEIRNYIKLGEPTIIFTDANKLQSIDEAVSGTGQKPQVISFGQDAAQSERQDLAAFIRDITADVESFRLEDMDREDTVILTCTSGSTGAPKAVELTTGGFVAGLPMLVLDGTPEAPDYQPKFLLLSSCQWVSYVYFTNLCTIIGSIKLQSVQPSTARHTMEILRKYRPNSMMTGPGLAIEIFSSPDHQEDDLSSIRVCLTGGAFVSEEVHSQMRREIHPEGEVYVGCGCTEAGGMYTLATSDCSPASIGKEVNILEHKIVDENDEEVAVGVTGELWVRGKYRACKGYYKDEAATKDTFTPDGWLKTGDLVYKDETGQYFYVDRKKLLIKIGSYHIYPLEVEGAIAEVAGVAKAGVCMTDRGLTALVEPRPGAVVTAQQVHDVVNAKLSYYKQLAGGVLFVPALPQTVSGKLDRAALKAVVAKLQTKIDDNADRLPSAQPRTATVKI